MPSLEVGALCERIVELSGWNDTTAGHACRTDHKRFKAWKLGASSIEAAHLSRLHHVYHALELASKIEQEANGTRDDVAMRARKYAKVREIRSALARGDDVPPRVFWGALNNGTSTGLEFTTTDVSAFLNPALQHVTYKQTRTRDGATRDTEDPSSLTDADWSK
jgi:hypothetical protein